MLFGSRVWVASLLLLSPGFACAPRSDIETGTSSKAAEHAVHDLKLRAIMRDLLRPLSSLPQEVDAQEMRRRYLAETGIIAAALAQAAREIPPVVDEVDLSEESRETFLSLAERLYQESVQLEEAADAGDLVRVEQFVDSINQTCQACHTRFRVLPVIEPGAG